MIKLSNRVILLLAIALGMMHCPSMAEASTVVADIINVSTIGGQATSNGVTFSSYVYMIAGSSLTLQGSGGFIMSSSSVNASAFFGDGSHLTGIPSASGAFVHASGDTMTGMLNMNASSITLSNSSITLTGTNGYITSASSITASGLFSTDATFQGTATASTFNALGTYQVNGITRIDSGGNLFAHNISGTANQFSYFTGTNGLSSNSNFVWAANILSGLDALGVSAVQDLLPRGGLFINAAPVPSADANNTDLATPYSIFIKAANVTQMTQNHHAGDVIVESGRALRERFSG